MKDKAEFNLRFFRRKLYFQSLILKKSSQSQRFRFRLVNKKSFNFKIWLKSIWWFFWPGSWHNQSGYTSLQKMPISYATTNFKNSIIETFETLNQNGHSATLDEKKIDKLSRAKTDKYSGAHRNRCTVSTLKNAYFAKPLLSLGRFLSKTYSHRLARVLFPSCVQSFLLK